MAITTPTATNTDAAIATGELGGAALLAALAIAAPIVALGAVVLLSWLAFRILRRLLRR